MSTWRCESILALVWVSIPLAAVVGCDERASVKQQPEITIYPRWSEFREVRRLAVVPFEATTPDGQARSAGVALSDRLSGLLAQSGAYEAVLERTQLRQLVDEQNLGIIMNFDDRTRIPQDLVQAAQVLVVGSLAECKVDDYIEQRQRIRYETYTDEYGNEQLRQVPYTVPFRVIRAVASASARVVDTATGRVIYSTPAVRVTRSNEDDDATTKVLGQDDEGRREDEEDKNEVEIESPEEALDQVLSDIANVLFKQLAPQQVRLRVGRDVLTLAKSYFDGEYVRTTAFLTSDDQVMVVITLPSEAKDNSFRVAISPENTPRNVAEETFTWTGSSLQQHVSFAMSSVLADAEPGFFVAKVYSGSPQPFATKRFRILAPKE